MRASAETLYSYEVHLYDPAKRRGGSRASRNESQPNLREVLTRTYQLKYPLFTPAQFVCQLKTQI